MGTQSLKCSALKPPQPVHLRRNISSQKNDVHPNHLVVDLDSMEWYFCNQEVGMVLKIFIGVLLGGAAGFGLSYLTRGIGSS